ncbi:MAG: RICIN domain-containing protein, partial [Ruminococcus sp.]|nr:RICIN domain-containing protein [Ruminococcus sp.]
MKNTCKQKLLGLLTSFVMGLTCLAGVSGAVPMEAKAASADYPAQLMRISTADNSRNLNITGTSDKSALNTWTNNGVQNENWRFDYVGTNSVGSYFKITNMGSGRLITPMGYDVSEGSSVVIYGSESAASQHWYVTAVSQDSYGNNLYYKITNYDDPDLALTYNSSANTISLSNYSGADNQKWLLNSAGLQGFAGYCKTPDGAVKAGSIGGLLGEIVEVDTFDELKAACTSTEPATIIITNDISGKTGTSNYEISTGYDGGNRYYCRDNYIYLQPNKTIIGSYGANRLHNVYFRTYNENYGPAYDVIIRNIDCTHDSELNTDNIWEFAYGWNFWIDHCYFEGHNAINTCSLGSTDWDKFLNFKGTSDYVTISDCKFGLHEYGVLLGYPTDDETTYNTYNGQPCVTLANNYYKDTITRAPALMRYGYFHSLNNYVYNFSMGYTVHSACKTFAEACYYEKGGSVICDWNKITYPGAYAEEDSVFVNVSRTVQGEGTSSNPSYSVACTWRPDSNYSYSALTAEEAKNYCTTYSGSQKSRNNYTYATFAETGMPSAGYVEAPTVGMLENITIDGGRLITEVNILDYSTSASWSVDTDIQIGDPVFGDRDVTYTSIPAGLIGGEAIVTACDAKSSVGDLASFTAGAYLDVYVALDQRVASLPAWLSGWEKTDGTVSNSKDVVFNLYKLSVPAGEIVTLGENGQSSGCVNYTVFAVKQGTAVVIELTAGDVNCDGIINVFDLNALKSGIHSGFSSEDASRCADVNADNVIDAADARLLADYLVGKDVTLVLPEKEKPVIPDVPDEPTTSYEPVGFQFSGKVYTVGDSTVCEYDSNTVSSLNRMGWGMQLANEYNNVKVNNLALSGRSSRSFLAEKNYTTLCNSIGAGDYLFIQFGHNDEKTDEATYPGLGTYPNLDMSTLDSNGMNSSGQYS